MEKPGTDHNSEVEVQRLLSEALNYDGLGRPVEAYQKYCESMDRLLVLIRASLDSKGPKARRLSSQSLIMAQNCITRMSDLVNEVAPSNLEGLGGESGSEMQTDSSDYLDVIEEGDGKASAESLMPDVVESTPIEPFSNLDKEEAIKQIMTYGPVSQARRRNESLANARTRMIQQLPALRNPKTVVALHLKMAREVYENIAVAKQQEESMIQHLMRLPKDNMGIVNDMIERREKTALSLNYRMSDFFSGIFGKVRDLQLAYKTKADEEAWMKRMRRALEECEKQVILEPVLTMMSQEDQPVGALVKDFLTRLRHQISDLLISGSSLKNPTEAISGEFHMFTDHFIGFLDHNYPELEIENYTMELKLTIQHFLFTTPIASEWMRVLRTLNGRIDVSFLTNCIAQSWVSDLPGKLGVKDKFLSSSWLAQKTKSSICEEQTPFQGAVEELRQIGVRSTPYQKITALLNCCTDLVRNVEQYTMEKGLDPSLGSEDLLLLLSFVVVRAQVPTLYSEIMFVSELVPEEILRGESGYVLATMQTCLSHLEEVATKLVK